MEYLHTLSKIIDNLYLGDMDNAVDKDLLDRHNIRDILSIMNYPKWEFKDRNYLLIDIDDSPLVHIDDYFPRAIRFIHQARLAGKPVLVHCAYGISRSVTIVVAYLMTVSKLSWETCLDAVQTVRPIADPNHGFMKQLGEYEVALAEKATNYQPGEEIETFWAYPGRDDDVKRIEELAEGNKR